jgi:hypothetical protein
MKITRLTCLFLLTGALITSGEKALADMNGSWVDNVSISGGVDTSIIWTVDGESLQKPARSKSWRRKFFIFIFLFQHRR